MSATFRGGLVDDRGVTIAVRRAGVAMKSLSFFSVAARAKGLVIGYGPSPTDRVDEGMDRVRHVLERTRRPGAG